MDYNLGKEILEAVNWLYSKKEDESRIVDEKKHNGDTTREMTCDSI